MRVSVRVRPGAPRTSVGGRYGLGEPPVLVVRVQQRAVDGRANEAVVDALADAFGVTRAAVRITAGARSRTKLVDVEGADDQVLRGLLERPS